MTDIHEDEEPCDGILKLSRKMQIEAMEIIARWHDDEIWLSKHHSTIVKHRSIKYRIDYQGSYYRANKNYANLAVQSNGQQSKTVASVQLQVGVNFGRDKIISYLEKSMKTGKVIRAYVLRPM